MQSNFTSAGMSSVVKKIVHTG